MGKCSQHAGKVSEWAKKPRNLIIKCSDGLRNRIFKYTSYLKGVRNKHGDFYFVNKMMPEQHLAERKETRYAIKKLKEQNRQNLRPHERKKWTIKKV